MKEGSRITLHYTGKLADGVVFDSSAGKDPLTFTIGNQEVIPGFEKALLDLEVGGKKTFTVSKEDGYQFHPELIQVIPRKATPPGLEITEGMMLALRAPTGQVIPAKVTKLTEESLTVDLNSPLAGKDLTFDVEIVKIEDKKNEGNKEEKSEENKD